MSASEDIELPEPRSNRPVTLMHRIEYALALTLGAFFRVLGVDAASAIAGGFMRRLGPLIGPITTRGRANLHLAFPDWSDKEVDAVLRDVWENIGRTGAEFSHLAAFDPDAGDRADIVGREKFEAVKASGKPAIFVSGHFANWEIMPRLMHAAGLDYAFVYRAANNPLIDALIIRERAKVMSRRQTPKGKRGGRDLIEALKAGVSLAMFVDQKLTSGIPSPLFGRPAMTAPAAARLALKYGAPVMPVELERLGGARFRLTVGDALDFTPTGDANADTQALTDRINLELERMIRARPGQWLWFHRRWGKNIGA
ncbi:MAG: lysophospholipid acyltransferase family protein [Parvularculaceae bacterium]|nr:lysophospholipid acyltransferase family protein [Parvularculaceae bacterium]